MSFSVEPLFEALWYNSKYFSTNKILHALFFTLMFFLSLGYKAIMILRKKAYQWHILKSYSSKTPLIVVGNLTVGGTGKTPLIIALVELLKKSGHRPGIVSRGYGGKSKNYPLSVNESTHPQEAGDEPVLLAHRTQCPIVVAPKRVDAIRFLQDNFDCTVILSDDGLQHLAMCRDIEILVIDGERQFGNGFLLPAGPLRESVKRCETVDFIIKNTSNNINPEAFIQLNSKKSFPLNTFNDTKEKSIHVVTGIGNPKRFLNTLKELDINLDANFRIFNDHHVFIQQDLEFDESEKMPIIMTEKDAVKCQYLNASNNIYYLKISANLDDSFKESFMKKFNLILEKKSCV